MDVGDDRPERLPETFYLFVNPNRVDYDQRRRVCLVTNSRCDTFRHPPPARLFVELFTVILQSTPFSRECCAVLTCSLPH